jgi:hypothetical protein
LHDDVKKKVQKNLPACIAPTRSHARRHEEVADDITTRRAHAGAGTHHARSRTLHDSLALTPRSQLLHTVARTDDKQRGARLALAKRSDGPHPCF